MRSDDDATSQAIAGCARECLRHEWRSLTHGNHPKAAVETRSNRGILDGLWNQVMRRRSLNRTTGNAQEMLTEAWQVRALQWTFFGSVQLDSPVTTLNFRRRSLTTLSAFSRAERCSS